MTTEDKKDDDLKLEERPDGAVLVIDPSEPPPKEEDEKLTAAPEGEADDPEAEEQGHAEETTEEAEARRQRNRERRAANKERRKEHIESLKRELAARDNIINEMNQRLAVVERKSSGSELAQLEAAEKEAVTFYNHFKQVNQTAIEQADGRTATDAQEKMYAAKQRYDQIQAIKKAVTNQQAPAPQALDPRLLANANEWMAKNSWYSPDGSDEDSTLMRFLDNQLAQQGWNPTTKEYWDELEARKRKYLPHRANSGHNVGTQGTRPNTASPVAASGGGQSSGKGSGGYVLSPERVQALKDAGMYDDPVKRNAMIRRYQQQDKEQRA